MIAGARLLLILSFFTFISHSSCVSSEDRRLLSTYSPFGCVTVPESWKWVSVTTSSSGEPWAAISCFARCASHAVVLISGDQCACSDYGKKDALLVRLNKIEEKNCQPCPDSDLGKQVTHMGLDCGGPLPHASKDKAANRAYSVYNVLI